MKPEDRRHEIKQILTEATSWCRTEPLDLAVEQIQGMLDRDRVKAALVRVDFLNDRAGAPVEE